MSTSAAIQIQRKQLNAQVRRAARAAQLAATVLLQMNLRSRGGRQP